MWKLARMTLAGAAISAPVGAYALVLRPWMRRWGADPTEAATVLPGDDQVPAPTGEVTRGITIDAAPDDVWPWLPQMGFGRGGWYSYDRLDMKGHSAREIHPEWQTLVVGDLVPTHPAGGFVVRAFEPGHALSLYLDTEIVREQGEASAAVATMPMHGGMAISGAVMGTQPQEFAAVWTFVVSATPNGQTRLVERVRFAYPAMGIGGRVATEAFGFGVFLMMRRQMLGIRERAEALAQSHLPAPFASPIGQAPVPA